MATAVHLINDEKFLPRFIERYEEHHGTCICVVFGKEEPYQFIQPSENIFNSTSWKESFGQIDDVYVHFMTYQKIQWIQKHAPGARVHWIYFGSDLYELLMVFHNLELIPFSSNSKKILPNVKGKTLYHRFARLIRLAYYHTVFSSFVKYRLTTFRFWNIGDFDLFKKHFQSNAHFKFFQYGSFSKSEIEYVKNVSDKNSTDQNLRILLNHSGTRSGNHLEIIEVLRAQDDGKMVMHPILSYGDDVHIKDVNDLGEATFKNRWNPQLDFISRLEYYHLLNRMNIAIFGHVRQEAGNSIFISMLLGTKVFIHPNSLLIPYLKRNQFIYFTLNDIGTKDWKSSLTDHEKETNRNAALVYFNEVRINQGYESLVSCSL